MMKRGMRRMAGFLGGVMLLGCIPALAEGEPVFYLNESFENYVTNKTPDGLSYAGARPKVQEEDGRNKRLLLPDGYSKVYFPTGKLPDYAVCSMDIQRSGMTPVSLNIQFTTDVNAAGTKVMQIENNTIKTLDGLYMDGLGEGVMHLDVALNNKSGRCDIYIDGKQKVWEWKLPAALGPGLLIEKITGEIVLDNVWVHQGSSLQVLPEPLAYNPEGEADISYDYRTNADYIMVDTNFLQDVVNSMEGRYHFASPNPKTNKITMNRLEHRNDPNRENNYIIIEKTTSDDAHIDFGFYSRSPVSETGYFPYYYMEGRVRADKLGAPIRVGYLRDNSTTAGTYDMDTLRILADGAVVTGGGKTVKRLAKGEWLNYRVALDLVNHRAQVYIDDKLADDYTYAANFNQPCMLRLWVDRGGSCAATWDSVRVVAMRHPFDINNPDQHPYLWTDDSGIDAFFADKTAFYGYSQNVASHGQKHIRVYTPLVKEDVVYVTPEALNVGYDFSLTTDAAARTAKDDSLTLTADSNQVTWKGETVEMSLPCLWENEALYVPVEAFAREVLKHQVKTDGEGLIVTAAQPFYLDTTAERPEYLILRDVRPAYKLAQYYADNTPIRVLNWYMSFERPGIETLREDFNAVTNNGAMHPRTIANPEDIQKVRENMEIDPVLKEKILAPVMLKADNFVPDPTSGLDYNIYDMQRILDLARMAMERSRYLSFAYQITKDTKYSDAAWKLMEKVLSYPDWNPSHAIDGGELCMAVGMAYDWIYDTLSPEQREFVYQRAKALALDLYKDIYRDMAMTRETRASGDFALAKSNFNTVCNGGLMVLALALADRDPDLCFDLLHSALRSIENTLLMYRPDGVWMESPSYWDYAASYLSKGIGSLIKSTGQSYGVLDAQGLRDTALWMRSIDGFVAVNDFHDGGRGKSMSPFLGWFGEAYNDPYISAAALNQITVRGRAPEPENAIWYVPNNDVSEDDLPMDVWGRGGLDSVVSRASYTDEDAMFFSAHAGLVTCYHSQVDVGTYVLDLMGRRWADDLGSEDYNLRAEMNFQVYRDRAEAHNVIVFHPDTSTGQDSDGVASVARYESKDRGTIMCYDMADCYKNYVSAYKRGFLVADDRRSLTVRDEFTPSTSTDGTWFLTTVADVEIVDNHTIRLVQGNKVMRLELDTNLEVVELSQGAAEPLPSSPHPVAAGGGVQNPNNGFTRIQLKFNMKAGTESYITARYVPEGEMTQDFAAVNVPMEQWQIPDGEFHKREALNAKIYIGGTDLDVYLNGNVDNGGRINIVEGQPLPEITATPINPNHSVEIIPGDPPDAYTVVRVYNADKSYWRDISLPFIKVASSDLSNFRELTVANCTVNAAPEEANQKENMFDGNFTSRWSSPNQAGSWAVFDLGEAQKVDGVAVAFWKGDTRSYHYEIQISDDGESWSTVTSGSSSGESEGYELVEIPSCNTRYVRFLGGGNTVNGHSNILEFRVLQRK